jgi:hypothetical protein
MGVNEKGIRIYDRNSRISVYLLSYSRFTGACERLFRLGVRDFYPVFHRTYIVNTSAFSQADTENQLGGKL